MTARSFHITAPGLTSLKDVSQVTCIRLWSMSQPRLSVCFSTSRLSMPSLPLSRSTTVSIALPWTPTSRLPSSQRLKSAPKNTYTQSSSACLMSGGLKCSRSMGRLEDGKRMQIPGKQTVSTSAVTPLRRTRLFRPLVLVARSLVLVLTLSFLTTLLLHLMLTSGKNTYCGCSETSLHV